MWAFPRSTPQPGLFLVSGLGVTAYILEGAYVQALLALATPQDAVKRIHYVCTITNILINIHRLEKGVNSQFECYWCNEHSSVGKWCYRWQNPCMVSILCTALLKASVCEVLVKPVNTYQKYIIITWQRVNFCTVIQH